MKRTMKSADKKSTERSTRKALLGVCLALLVLAAILAAFSQVRRYALAALAASPQRPLKRIVMINTPAYLSRAILDSLAREAVAFTIFNSRHPEYAAEIRNPLDGKILKTLSLHYTQHPEVGFNAWIKHIVFIRRAWLPHEQVIQIDAQYRHPAALIKMSNKYYLVSRSAVRLPGSYLASQRAALRWLFTIQGVAGPPPRPGKIFASPAVAAGIRLAKILTGQPYASQIRAIDVARVGRPSQSHPEIALITRYHTQIYWGQPPGVRSFFEVPTDRKLDYLSAIYQQYHRIDAGRAFVDLRGDQVLVPSRSQTQPVYAPVTPTFPG